MTKGHAPERTHLYYFDYIRILGMLMVVFMHVVAVPLRSMPFDWHWQVLNVVTSVSFTAVPLFFMMSGYLLIQDPTSGDVKKLLHKRLPRLIVPLAVWTIIAILLHADYAQSSSQAVLKMLLGALQGPFMTHFWYLYTLIAIYAISPVICAGVRALNITGKWWVFAIIAIVNIRVMLSAVVPEHLKAYLAWDIIIKMEFLGAHLGTFILGYLLGQYQKRIHPAWLIGVGLATLVVIVLGTSHVSQQVGMYDQTFQSQSAGYEIVLASCMFLWFKQYTNRPHRSRFVQLGVRLSLGVYLMHNVVLNMFYRREITFASMSEAFTGTLLITGICLLVLYLSTRVRLLCFLLTGTPYRKHSSR